MAGSVVSKRNDNKRSNKSAGPGRLSRDELKKLFMLRTDTDCDTYDVLAGDGGAVSTALRSAQARADCVLLFLVPHR